MNRIGTSVPRQQGPYRASSVIAHQHETAPDAKIRDCPEDMRAWCSRPLLPVYAAVFIDVIYVKVRDGVVGNQPSYAAVGVDLEGKRDVLGLWVGGGGRGVGELDERAGGSEEPRRAGHLLRRLRRPERVCPTA